eukprot:TRINITY_DN5434_c0_g1_i2.p1 TRINITY_DN5434_c0_g1~~TRINITY_DN5434_c0_g1_i2.p1  ORF type:complete len:487 (+),score=80.56 TRINITY_DN5434_c0_g1_i2:110-1570(+)
MAAGIVLQPLSIPALPTPVAREATDPSQKFGHAAVERGSVCIHLPQSWLPATPISKRGSIGAQTLSPVNSLASAKRRPLARPTTRSDGGASECDSDEECSVHSFKVPPASSFCKAAHAEAPGAVRDGQGPSVSVAPPTPAAGRLSRANSFSSFRLFRPPGLRDLDAAPAKDTSGADAQLSCRGAASALSDNMTVFRQCVNPEFIAGQHFMEKWRTRRSRSLGAQAATPCVPRAAPPPRAITDVPATLQDVECGDGPVRRPLSLQVWARGAHAAASMRILATNAAQQLGWLCEPLSEYEWTDAQRKRRAASRERQRHTARERMALEQQIAFRHQQDAGKAMQGLFAGHDLRRPPPAPPRGRTPQHPAPSRASPAPLPQEPQQHVGSCSGGGGWLAPAGPARSGSAQSGGSRCESGPALQLPVLEMHPPEPRSSPPQSAGGCVTSRAGVARVRLRAARDAAARLRQRAVGNPMLPWRERPLIPHTRPV